MKTITFGKFKFIKAWAFPKDIEKFADYLMGKFGGNVFDKEKRCFIENKWTHIFCGESFLGDLRIDIIPKRNVTLVADYKNLVDFLGKNSQDNIILDPPWQIKPLDRMNISYVVRDLLKIGGTAIFNCTWNPWVIGLSKIIDENSFCYVPQSHFNNYLDGRLWWVLHKLEVIEK